MRAMIDPDVLVVGGGVIGLAVARHLASRGASVTLVERGTPGQEASWAAAGMLSPLAEAREPGVFLDLLITARERFPAYAAELRERTGIDVGYRSEGTLLLALRADDEEELEDRFRWQSAAGMPVERLDAVATRRLEPAVSPEVRWSLRFPGDHQVENRSLARALWSAAAQEGVSFRLGTEAVRLIRSGSRAEGIELADGQRLHAGTVVLAAGSWTGRIQDLPRPVPVVPVHGQLLALEAQPSVIRYVVDSPRCYLVPRADGRLLVGATAEHRGFHKVVTPRGMLHLLQGALEIAPCLAELPIVETWAGLRPGTPDDLPILGRDPDLANLIYATGHFRNGILLAPLTGELIGELILDGSGAETLEPFSVARFG
jgi:glycine oxidase